MLKFVLPAVVVIALILVSVGVILSQEKPISPASLTQTEESSTEPAPITNKQSTPLPPLQITSASDSALVARVNQLSTKVSGLTEFDTKVDNLEKQIDDLERRLAKLESGATPLSSAAPSSTPIATTAKVTGPMYLYALGYGGSSNSTDWADASTLSIAFDPGLYPGYKSLQLEAYMHVRDGNGKAFARLNSSGTPATASETSSSNYQDEWVSGGTFTWNSKAIFTLQVKSLTGYDAYISNARLKINF